MTWRWNRKRKWKKPKNQVSVLKRFLSRNIFIFQGFQIIREAPEDLLESIGWQVEERSNFLFHSILLSSESSSNARHNGVTKKSKVRYFTFIQKILSDSIVNQLFDILTNTILDWGGDERNWTQYKVAGKKSFVKTLKDNNSWAFRMVKCSYLDCWRNRDRRKFTGRDPTRYEFQLFPILLFNFMNFRFLRSHLAVLVMRNAWKCSKIKYEII